LRKIAIGRNGFDTRFSTRMNPVNHEGADDEADRAGIAPAPGLRLDNAEDQQEQPGREAGETCVVEPAAGVLAALAQHQHADDERGDTDRDVDVEDAGPVEVLQEHAREDRAPCGGCGRDGAPDTDRRVELRRRKCLAQ